MWAVGRLSLLSSGLEAAKRAQAANAKPTAVARVAEVPSEPAALPIPIPEPIPAPIAIPANDTVPIPAPPPQPLRLETVPFTAEGQLITKAHPVVKPEPPIAPVIDQRVNVVSPEAVKPPVAASIPVPAPVPVEVAPAAPVETPSLLRRIVTRVTRFFRSLFG